MQRCASAPALCGRSAESDGDDQPAVAIHTGCGQVQHDAAYRGLHSGAEFHQVFAQGADLGRAEGGARGAQAQFLVEHVARGGQQSAQLVGEEAAATGAVDFQTMMQLFDPVFDVTPGAVDRLVQMPGRVFQVRHHEAQVVFGRASRMLQGSEKGIRSAIAQPDIELTLKRLTASYVR